MVRVKRGLGEVLQGEVLPTGSNVTGSNVTGSNVADPFLDISIVIPNPDPFLETRKTDPD